MKALRFLPALPALLRFGASVLDAARDGKIDRHELQALATEAAEALGVTVRNPNRYPKP